VSAVKRGREQQVTHEDIEHIECLITDLPTELTDAQRVGAIEFLSRNLNIFSKSEFDIGKTHLVEHRIEISDSRLVRQALRRHPVAFLPPIDNYVQEMQEIGLAPNGCQI